MAAQLLDLNYDTHFARFTIDSESDLNNLPKIDTAGKDNLNTINNVSQGSMAYCTDGKDYILSGENEWIEYIPTDNSISKYDKLLGVFSHDFLMTNISISESNNIYYGTADLIYTQSYDYIYKVADLIATKNNQNPSDVIHSDLVEQTYGIINFRRNGSNVFPFFNTIINSIKYNKISADPLGAKLTIGFNSTVSLSDLTTNNTYTTVVSIDNVKYTGYPCAGIVTVLSK